MVIESVDPEHRRVDKAFDRENPVGIAFGLDPVEMGAFSVSWGIYLLT